MTRSFGIIGAGNIGQSIARHLARAGYPVSISNSRGVGSLTELVTKLGKGVKAAGAADAAKADIVILAIPWKDSPALSPLTDWNGKLVIDAMNHFVTYFPDFQLADLGDQTSSEVVQTYVPGARVVKAFNTLSSKILDNDPKEANGRRVLFVSGDDAEGKKEVMDMIKAIGFAPVDLGSLSAGGRLQQAKGSLAGLNLVQL